MARVQSSAQSVERVLTVNDNIRSLIERSGGGSAALFMLVAVVASKLPAEDFDDVADCVDRMHKHAVSKGYPPIDLAILASFNEVAQENRADGQRRKKD